jgi:hypothetical protein
MAITTDYIGHISVEPAMEADHIDEVVELSEAGLDGDSSMRLGWKWDAGGRRLTFEECDKEVAEPAASLRLMIGQYLKQDGVRLDGMVVGCRRGTNELFAIQVVANRVTQRTLWPRRDQPRETSRPRSSVPIAKVIDLASRRAQG